jgi:hypothetical protein
VYEIFKKRLTFESIIRNLYCEVIAPLTRLYAHPNVLDQLKTFMLLLYPEVRTYEPVSSTLSLGTDGICG